MNKNLPPVRVALGADFLKAFSSIPPSQQKQVREFVDKFITAPDASGLNYEKIHSAADPQMRSVRMSQGYRGIVLKPERGNVYMLLWVDKHDDAYAWASRRRCSIHPQTGSIQVLLTEESVEEVVASVDASTSAGEMTSAQNKSIFTSYSDDDLCSLGIPEEMLGHVRNAMDDEGVEKLEKILPREAFEAAFLLAAGYSVEEAKDQLGLLKTAPVNTEDYEAAVERDTTRRNFIVITDSAEMEQLLSAPLEQWRVFLHPSQRRLVEMRANGPVRVLGSAGTGKTVVAMHRAAWLARTCCGPGQKLLFTTFTRNLAADIRSNLQKICSREEWEKIEVINLDAWARRFLEKQGFIVKLNYEDSEGKNLWEKAIQVSDISTEFSKDFLRAEWDNVIQASGIEDVKGYLIASRAGRSQRLSRQQRQAIWPIFEEYRALLNERGLSEPADAYRSAAKLISSGMAESPYRCVIVDEAQDFGNEAFRLIRALAEPSENDLFIVGDAHQRIYGHQVVLSRSGVDIRGRSKKLRINYRTPEEIKNWATGLLKGLSFDDLDAGIDDMQGIRSLVHGEPPIHVQVSNDVAVAESVTDYIKKLIAHEEVKPETICVVAETHDALEQIARYLKPVCASVHQIEPGKAEDSSQSGVRMATIHRVKGLEFDHVVIAGRFDPKFLEEGESDIKKRMLLYVAATRARKSLFVCRKV
jgi:hypothetical protein